MCLWWQYEHQACSMNRKWIVGLWPPRVGRGRNPLSCELPPSHCWSTRCHSSAGLLKGQPEGTCKTATAVQLSERKAVTQFHKHKLWGTLTEDQKHPKDIRSPDVFSHPLVNNRQWFFFILIPKLDLLFEQLKFIISSSIVTCNESHTPQYPSAWSGFPLQPSAIKYTWLWIIHQNWKILVYNDIANAGNVFFPQVSDHWMEVSELNKLKLAENTEQTWIYFWIHHPVISAILFSSQDLEETAQQAKKVILS